MASLNYSDELFKLARGGRGSASSGAGGAFALKFPQNISGPDTTAPYAVIEFADPHLNGLPIWGAGGGGITVVRRLQITSPSQQGYYVGHWWSQANGVFDPASGYWGMHPYPQTATNLGTTHWWEISEAGRDVIDFLGNGPGVPGNAISVVYGTTFDQILMVSRAGPSDKTLTFYPDATNTASPNFVSINETSANYGETVPPTPKFTVGDSPWFAGAQHERFGGTLDAIKIFTPILTLAQAQQERDFSQVFNTGIWWGKNGFNSVDDLVDSYGTGRTFVRNDASNLLTTVPRL
jgi:hypothetical protein